MQIKMRNGQVTVTGATSETIASWLDLTHSFANFSTVDVHTHDEQCVEKLARNESDFFIGFYSIHNISDKFAVPVPAMPMSLYILSGYNLFKYRNEEIVRQENAFGVLQNFASFSLSIYAVISLWMLINFLIIFTRLLMVQRTRNVVRALKRSLKHFATVRKTGSRKWPLLSLTLSAGLFLLLAPFSILFKTNQVVARKPVFVTSYEQIMSQRMKVIYSPIGPNLLEILNLRGDTASASNTLHRMVEYFNSNSVELTYDFDKVLDLVNKWTRELIKGNAVFIASDAVSESFRQVFCSWSQEPDLYQVMRLRDPNQGEIVTGFALRREMSGKVSKKMLRAFEAHIPSKLLTMINTHIGFYLWKFASSRLHQQRQLIVCQRRNAIHNQREDILTPGLTFFTFFLLILIAFLVAALIILRFEKCVSAVKRAKKIAKRRVAKVTKQPQLAGSGPGGFGWARVSLLQS